MPFHFCADELIALLMLLPFARAAVIRWRACRATTLTYRFWRRS
jgi:hypothetical protein